MIESFPLYWPEGWPRARSREHSRFKMSFGRARDNVLDQIRMLGGSKIVISSNLPLRQRDGLPYARTGGISDPGVAVYFTYKGKDMCFACDRYFYVESNTHAIGLSIEAIRGLERWGASDMMERAFRGFTALPAPKKSWREVLGFRPDEQPNILEITARFRELAKIHHPDTLSGDSDRFREILEAKDAAISEVDSPR